MRIVTTTITTTRKITRATTKNNFDGSLTSRWTDGDKKDGDG